MSEGCQRASTRRTARYFRDVTADRVTARVKALAGVAEAASELGMAAMAWVSMTVRMMASC